jgi:hypothetical protein
MKKMLVLTCALALLGGTTAMADYYATKADYKAGKLTPAGPLPKGSGNDCMDSLFDLLPPSPRIVNGDTTGSTNTVDTLPLGCNGNYTVAPGPDDIWTFTLPGTPNGLTFTVSTSDNDYDPSIYTVTTCGDGSTCLDGWGSDGCWAVNAAGNPCGANSTEAFTFPSQLNPGQPFFFYVDSFYAPANPDGRDVGPYTLTITGQWPVELMEFSVD